MFELQSMNTLEHLAETLETLESSEPSQGIALLSKASYSFLQLKSGQRMVLEKLNQIQEKLVKQRELRNEQELKLENLNYQKVLNEHSIQVCQKLKATQLFQVCCDELGRKVPESAEDSEKLLHEFLGANPRDPKQRGAIEAKLNTEINARKKLEAELKASRLKATSLKQRLASKRKLLQELPVKLQEMERSSLPLQKFCQKSLNSSRKLGSKRRTCLDLAQSLPKPTYTLYYQLQSCLDIMANTGEMKDPSPFLEITKESTTVVLKIPIPNVSDSSASQSLRSKKVATISFEYSEELNLVTAYSNTEHDMGALVGELFPGDTGEWTDGDGDEEKADREKRPYHWCNYLAGLHIATVEQAASKLQISTRVVLKALIRRVRSTATLHWLLQSLSRKPQSIPIHPAMKDFFSQSDSSVKLLSWTEKSPYMKGKTHHVYDCREFKATLKRKTVSLEVHVRVNVARYPAVPPTWEFATNDSQESQNGERGSSETVGNESTLYDDRLASLERRINRDVEQLVMKSEETTYDWILSHQLAEIVKEWENIQAIKS